MNRQKALARLKQRGIIKTATANNSNTKNDGLSQANIKDSNTRKSFEPTPEQKQLIKENREKALERLKQRQNNLRDASKSESPAFEKDKRPLDKIRPSVRRQHYIEYDFSTMKNSYGGFINTEDTAEGENNKRAKTLEDWQEEQKNRRMLFEEEMPAFNISSAPRCTECQVNIEMDPLMKKVFKLQVCKTCVKNHPEKYSLLTKTECKEDYFLTDPELSDTTLLDRLDKPNPHSGTFSRMQLFVRCQVEAYAFEKWGGEEGLDKEWQRREEGRTARREKKYQQKLKEMRLKTRAQEYTTRLKELKHGKKHVHEFSDAIDGGLNEDNVKVQKRRCMTCGLEIEEIGL